MRLFKTRYRLEFFSELHTVTIKRSGWAPQGTLVRIVSHPECHNIGGRLAIEVLEGESAGLLRYAWEPELEPVSVLEILAGEAE